MDTTDTAATTDTTDVITTVSKATPPSAKSLSFHWADYLVFSLSLAVTLGIGVFLMFYKRKQRTTADFLVGERSLNFVAVALSLLASLLNGIFVIGGPAEIHYYGTEIALFLIGILFATVVTAHVFIPKYHSFNFTSAYEYLEARFNYATRVIASAIFCLSVIIFMAVVLFVPALAFAQVTQLSTYITIILTGVICTIYTSIGGIRAVVWTDALQIVILIVGLLVIAIMGSIRVGGSQEVWDIAERNGRIIFDEFSVDPRVRHTLWTQSLGQGVTYMGIFISSQMMIQRYITVPTARRAQMSLYITFLVFIPLMMLITFIGLVVHAYYYKCDPLASGKIKKGDQIFPLFIMELLGEYHGVPGLITASVFAAALSSVSSVINSLAAVILEDFISPAVIYFKDKPLKDTVKRWIAFGLVLFFGCLTIGLSYGAEYVTDKLIQASGTVWGAVGGPLAGVFIMGFFMPFCNSWGAITGMLGSLIFTLWISVGNVIYTETTRSLPVGICRGNISIPLPPPNPNVPLPQEPPTGLSGLYRISYAWYGVISIGSCILIGIVISLITCGASKAHRKSISSSLYYPCGENCYCCCPTSCRKACTWGVEGEAYMKRDENGVNETVWGNQNYGYDQQESIDNKDVVLLSVVKSN